MSSLPSDSVEVVTGDWLLSGFSYYQVQSFLGQGTFGKVAKCTRMEDMKTVAVKLMKSQGSNIRAAKEEVSNLLKLKMLDADKSHLVRWYQVFSCRGHICLEFEHLDKSLDDFMKERYYRPLPLKEIRPIVQQLATALDHLKTAGIIHADLKLENVMLVDHVREPYKVKVIDFGLACDVSATRLGSYIQTRPYRSPEIILGLPFTEAIDMWSLGCMVATLYLGTLLYPGRSEYDMMRYMVETQGQPPGSLLNGGFKTGIFFQRDNSTTSLWKLKTPERIHRETGIQSMETRRVKLSSLFDLMQIRVIKTENSADKVAQMTDLLMFVNMLNEMLELDPAKRLTPRQVLEHQFISMSHLVDMCPLSSHAKSCFEIMDACQKTLTSDSGKAECGSSPSSAAHSIQQKLPPPSAERSGGLNQPHCLNPHPCTTTQTASSVKSGMKRKLDDEDGSMSSHPSKRINSSWHRKSYVSPSSSSSSHPAQPRHQSNNAHFSSHAQGLKRKVADGEDVDRHQRISDHFKRSDDDRKRFRRSFAPPSTSGSSSRTQSSASPRVKRKMAEDDDHDSERPHQERKRVRRSYAGRSPCSSSESTHTLYDRPNWRNGQTEHHRHHLHPASSTQTESRARSGVKRKADDDDEWHRKRISKHQR